MLPSEFILECNSKDCTSADVSGLQAIADEVNRRVGIIICFLRKYNLGANGYTISMFTGAVYNDYHEEARKHLVNMDEEVRSAAKSTVERTV